MSKIISGITIADQIAIKLRTQVLKLARPPQLVVVRIGNDPASEIYVRQKQKFAERIGVNFVETHFTSGKTDEIGERVSEIGNDPANDAVILQLPLPANLQNHTDKLLAKIPAKKDVDGFLADSPFHAQNPVGQAVVTALTAWNPNWREKSITLVGHGQTGGKPIERTLLNENFLNLHIIDENTVDPEKIIRKCEVVISAVGRANLIDESWVQKNFFAVQVGILRNADGKLCGDFSDAALAKSGAITPIPGGIGPLTVASLLRNVVAVKSEM